MNVPADVKKVQPARVKIGDRLVYQDGVGGYWRSSPVVGIEKTKGMFSGKTLWVFKLEDSFWGSFQYDNGQRVFIKK